MFWLNNSETGNRMEVESYDKVIQIFELLYPNNYSIEVDDKMPDVWWIYVDGYIDPSFMLTNLQPARQVEIEEEN